MSYIISELLTEDQVSEMRSALDSSQSWYDGIKSISNPSLNPDIKKNIELDQQTESYRQASSILYNALDRCVDFADFTVGEKSGPVMFSRTLQGGYYKTHFDAPDMGEFSNTVFLSDPDEYSGGELILMNGNHSEKIKLKSGSMITYSCGISHQVNEVTSGTREVAVFWTRSKFKNSRHREIYSDLRKALRYLPYKIPDSVEESQREPSFLIRQVMQNLERYQAEL